MPSKKILITGGAGFIGCNAARYFGARNWNVTVLDNLSRAGTDKNLRWLRDGTTFDFEQADVRDQAAHRPDPRGRPGSMRSCILRRRWRSRPRSPTRAPISRSTRSAHSTCSMPSRAALPGSGVHLRLDQQGLRQDRRRQRRELRGSRYAYVDRPHGISESEPLDFLSPYGCSKGAADQYALDFARIYEIPATSFRQSCIYGPRQFGVEDQGWVAWFAIASMLGRDITIFGDGKQVRDVLHVDDLLRAYEAAIRAPDKVAQQAFNVGGGPDNVVSCSI